MRKTIKCSILAVSLGAQVQLQHGLHQFESVYRGCAVREMRGCARTSSTELRHSGDFYIQNPPERHRFLTFLHFRQISVSHPTPWTLDSEHLQSNWV